MFSTYEIIQKLCKSHGMSLRDLEDKLGYSRNTLYLIKKTSPSAARLAEIADYFNVSVDYLLGRTQHEESIKAEVDLLLQSTDNTVTYQGVVLSDEEKEVVDKATKLALFDFLAKERVENQ